MNDLNGLQLMHYVRSEQSLGESHIPIQADYALDGQFVSNWEDILQPRGYTKKSTLFLKPHVEFIALPFVISLIIYCLAIFLILSLLLYIVFFKLIQHYRMQNPKIFSSANSVYVSVRISLTLLGIAMFATELSYINNFSSDHYLIKGKLILIIFSLGIYTFIMVIISCYICINLRSKQQNIILFTLECVDFLSAFIISWILISSYATLLYSLAYPIYVIILVTLHVTIFIVTIIIFGVFVPNVISYVISYWKKCTHVLLRSVLICCTTIGFVVLVVGVCAIYVTVICVYGSTIVERIFPQDGLVQALLLFPSLSVFVGAWLLQRKVFSKCSKFMMD